MHVSGGLRWIWFAVVLTSGCASQDAATEGDADRSASARKAAMIAHGTRDTTAGTAAARIAQYMLGKPYRFGGASPAGFDCSGLVHYAFGKAGQAVPRETTGLYRQARQVDVSKLKPGDLLFFRIEGKVSHVAIYVDADRFVHSPSSGKRVSYGSLSNPYWKTRLVKAGRISQ